MGGGAKTFLVSSVLVRNPEGLRPAIDATSVPPIFELLSFKNLLKH